MINNIKKLNEIHLISDYTFSILTTNEDLLLNIDFQKVFDDLIEVYDIKEEVSLKNVCKYIVSNEDLFDLKVDSDIDFDFNNNFYVYVSLNTVLVTIPFSEF